MTRNLPPELWNLIDSFRDQAFQKRIRHLQRKLRFPDTFHEHPLCHTGCHYLIKDEFNFSDGDDPLSIRFPVNHKIIWCHDDNTFQMMSSGMGRHFVVANYDYFDGSVYIMYP